MKETKPQNVITIIHTGVGDNGQTNLGVEKIPKTDPRIEYVGLLDTCQSYCYFDKNYNDYFNIFYDLQDVLFLLGGLVNNPNKKEYLVKLDEYYEKLKNHLEYILKYSTATKTPLTGFIRTTNDNYKLMQLRCVIRDAERTAVYLNELNFVNKIHVKILNLASDIIFALVWDVSVRLNSLQVWTGE